MSRPCEAGSSALQLAGRKQSDVHSSAPPTVGTHLSEVLRNLTPEPEP